MGCAQVTSNLSNVMLSHPPLKKGQTYAATPGLYRYDLGLEFSSCPCAAANGPNGSTCSSTCFEPCSCSDASCSTTPRYATSGGSNDGTSVPV